MEDTHANGPSDQAPPTEEMMEMEPQTSQESVSSGTLVATPLREVQVPEQRHRSSSLGDQRTGSDVVVTSPPLRARLRSATGTRHRPRSRSPRKSLGKDDIPLDLSSGSTEHTASHAPGFHLAAGRGLNHGESILQASEDLFDADDEQSSPLSQVGPDRKKRRPEQPPDLAHVLAHPIPRSNPQLMDATPSQISNMLATQSLVLESRQNPLEPSSLQQSTVTRELEPDSGASTVPFDPRLMREFDPLIVGSSEGPTVVLRSKGPRSDNSDLTANDRVKQWVKDTSGKADRPCPGQEPLVTLVDFPLSDAESSVGERQRRQERPRVGYVPPPEDLYRRVYKATSQATTMVSCTSAYLRHMVNEGREEAKAQARESEARANAQAQESEARVKAQGLFQAQIQSQEAEARHQAILREVRAEMGLRGKEEVVPVPALAAAETIPPIHQSSVFETMARMAQSNQTHAVLVQKLLEEKEERRSPRHSLGLPSEFPREIKSPESSSHSFSDRSLPSNAGTAVSSTLARELVENQGRLHRTVTEQARLSREHAQEQAQEQAHRYEKGQQAVLDLMAKLQRDQTDKPEDSSHPVVAGSSGSARADRVVEDHKVRRLTQIPEATSNANIPPCGASQRKPCSGQFSDEKPVSPGSLSVMDEDQADPGSHGCSPAPARVSPTVVDEKLVARLVNEAVQSRLAAGLYLDPLCQESPVERRKEREPAAARAAPSVVGTGMVPLETVGDRIETPPASAGIVQDTPQSVLEWVERHLSKRDRERVSSQRGTPSPTPPPTVPVGNQPLPVNPHTVTIPTPVIPVFPPMHAVTVIPAAVSMPLPLSSAVPGAIAVLKKPKKLKGFSGKDESWESYSTHMAIVSQCNGWDHTETLGNFCAFRPCHRVL